MKRWDILNPSVALVMLMTLVLIVALAVSAGRPPISEKVVHDVLLFYGAEPISVRFYNDTRALADSIEVVVRDTNGMYCYRWYYPGR